MVCFGMNGDSVPLKVDARNIDGSTPLCDACAAGSLECVKLLLEYGATVNPPLFTFSPLHEACMGGVSPHCKENMFEAVYFTRSLVPLTDQVPHEHLVLI